MISFRYHIVSIIGIFLAFALGVAVGTAALNGAVTDRLRSQVNSLQSTGDSLRRDNQGLTQTVDAQNQFAATYGPALLGGSLTGHGIALVQAPGATDAEADAIAANLQAAGAQVSGRITLALDYFDRARAGDIRALATGPAHPAGLQLPATDDVGQLGGAMLAYVLVGAANQSDISMVMAGFTALQMVKVAGGAMQAGDLAIVVTGGAFGAQDDATAAMISALAQQLRAGGKGAVVAGDPASAGAGGAVSSIRANAAASAVVSTVDDADGPLGQLTAVLALAEQLAGKAGQYGIGPGASGIAPASGG
ncbi:MAG: copper transporter [Frankiaceae bacterium]|nr:copper transporter [Frankiaceae bacterium]